MKVFLKFVSICLLASAFSCSPRISSGSAEAPGIICTDSVSRKFNLQLDFGKNHFSGMLIARKMPGNEVRLLFTTYFGLSVFDLSLREGSLHVNSCVEPMRKKKMLSLLEKDLSALFLPGGNVRVKERRPGFEKRVSGGGISKAVITVTQLPGEGGRQVRLKHPWIRLKMQLDEIDI